eukprot:TRINITY_DN1554_c0_g1_i1.p1 TRINITY_DN1554_c0_g1~~TRINITY_DN1554_c0_g1_i1.p1  ORF type:complete len:1542 (-),score=478.79 TRINITY_DN1554_c0_g1_i1:221-4846(-)
MHFPFLFPSVVVACTFLIHICLCLYLCLCLSLVCATKETIKIRMEDDAPDSSGSKYSKECSALGITARPHVIKSFRGKGSKKLTGSREMSVKDVIAMSHALPFSTTITLVKLQGTLLGIEGSRALSEAIPRCRNLKRLFLKGNSIGPEGAKHLASGLVESKTLEEVAVVENPLMDSGVSSISTLLEKSKRLKSLSLRDVLLGDEGVEVLSRSLMKNRTLLKLDLSANRIQKRGCVFLSRALPIVVQLHQLEIHDNPLGNAGVSALAEVLLRFECIDLRRCSIGVSGAERFAQAIATRQESIQPIPLQILRLSHNRIGSRGARSIANVLSRLTKLEELALENNKIGDAGGISLGATLDGHPSIRQLFMGRNILGDAGVIRLADCLETNDVIRLISMEHNFLSEDGEIELAKRLEFATSRGQVDISNQHARGEFPLSLAEEEAYFDGRDEEKDRLGEIWETYMRMCQGVGKACDPRLVQVIQDMRGDNTVSTLEIGEDDLELIDATAGEEKVANGALLVSRRRQLKKKRQLLEKSQHEMGDDYVDDAGRGKDGDGEEEGDYDAMMLDDEFDDPEMSGILFGGAGDENEYSEEEMIATDLDLSSVAIGDIGAVTVSQILAASGALVNLRLDRCAIGQDGARSLSDALRENSLLQYLSLEENPLGVSGCISICQAIGSCPSLQGINMNSTGMNDRALSNLARSIERSGTIRTISMAGNMLLTQEGFADLGRSIVSSGAPIEELYLDGNGMGDESLRLICSALETRKRTMPHLLFRVLSVSHNQLLFHSGKTIANLIEKDVGLEVVVIDANKLGDIGSEILSSAVISCGTMHRFSIRHNELSPEGLTTIGKLFDSVRSVPESALEEVYLDQTGSIPHPLHVPDPPKSSREAIRRQVHVLEETTSRTLGAPPPTKSSSTSSAPPPLSHPQSQPPSMFSGAGGQDRSAPTRSSPPMGGTASGTFYPMPSASDVAGSSVSGEYSAMSSDELADEITNVMRDIQVLTKQKEKLMDLYRSVSEREKMERFTEQKRIDLERIRSDPREMQPIPVIHPVTAGEKLLEQNMLKQHKSRMQALEEETMQLMKSAEENTRVKRQFDTTIQSDLFEMEELESGLRTLMISRPVHGGSGSEDGGIDEAALMLQAENLDAKKASLEEDIFKNSQSKSTVILQQIDRMRQCLQRLGELSETKKQRLQHLEDMLRLVDGSLPSPDMLPQNYQQAVQQLEHLIELRKEVEDGQLQLDELVEQWYRSREEVNRCWAALHESEREEEQKYRDVEEGRRVVQECLRSEELFRTRIGVSEMTIDEILGIIPYAQERYEFLSPMVVEHLEIEGSLETTQRERQKLSQDLSHWEELNERRKRTLDVLQQFNEVRIEIDRKRAVVREWEERLSASLSRIRGLEEDRSAAMEGGDLLDFKTADAELQKRLEEAANMEKTRDAISQEMAELDAQARAMLSEVESENKEEYQELLLAVHMARTQQLRKKMKTFASAAGRMRVAIPALKQLGGSGGSGHDASDVSGGSGSPGRGKTKDGSPRIVSSSLHHEDD